MIKTIENFEFIYLTTVNSLYKDFSIQWTNHFLFIRFIIPACNYNETFWVLK